MSVLSCPVCDVGVLWQTVGWIKMKLGTQVGLDHGHIVLDGHPASLPKKGNSPLQFSAHVHCGQTAGCINIPLGTKVGLGPGYIVLDGDPAPPLQGAAPSFRPMSVVARRLDGSRCHLVAQATSCYRGSSFPQKGHSPPIFGPCLLWPSGRPSQLLLTTCYYRLNRRLRVIYIDTCGWRDRRA